MSSKEDYQDLEYHIFKIYRAHMADKFLEYYDLHYMIRFENIWECDFQRFELQ